MIQQYNLHNLIEKVGRNEIERFISTFECNLDREIEHFLLEKAIIYEQHNISRTFLVVNDNHEHVYLLAYYTIVMKEFKLEEKLSRSKKKKYLGTTFEINQPFPAILIGRIGKNTSVLKQLQISGENLMLRILETVNRICDYAGGRLLYVEAKDNKYLHTFYTASSFSLYHDESNQPIVNKQGLFTYLLPCSKCF